MNDMVIMTASIVALSLLYWAYKGKREEDE